MHHNLKNVKRQTTILWGLVSVALLLVVGRDSAASAAKFGVGPDNNQSVLISHLRSACEDLTINIYLMDNPEIAKVIIDRIGDGITVRMLVEGQPFGQMTANGKQILNSIQAAMVESGNKKHRFFLMTKPENGDKRRYRYNHAKYVIADGQRSFISSENFTDSGHTKAGFIGNRGWDVVLDDSAISNKLKDTFAEDTNPAFGDVRNVTVTSENTDLPAEKPGKIRKFTAIEKGSGRVSKATLITSPDSMGDLVEIIEGAKESVSIEHMSLPLNWRAPNKGQNPVVTALIQAAQRGVIVRVILNDESVFGRLRPPVEDENGNLIDRGNILTVNTLNSIHKSENIPLYAQIVNVKQTGITYVHNKGIVVDGKRALVSSINGSQTSVMSNREVAVLLESPAAAEYYGAVFNFDWENSQDTAPKNPAIFDLNQIFAFR